MVTTPEFVDAVRRQQRAARHTISVTLFVHGLAVAGLTVVNTHYLWKHHPLEVFVPCVVYLTLWLVVRLRGRLTGIGGGREGFGSMALVGLLIAFLFPFGFVAVMFVGSGTLLGLGLTVLGARLRAPRLWGAGIALVALCPFVSLGTFDNHAQFLGPQPGTMVVGVLAVLMLSLAADAYRTERTAAMVPPQP
jgi:hypothetical protein